MPLFLMIFILLLSPLLIYGGWRAVPWVPTRSGDIERLLKLANIQAGQKFYDLGAGDGRMVYAMARAGAIAEGLEIFILPYLLAQIRRLFLKNKEKYRVRYKNFWRADLSDADIVYFFLLPKVYPKLKVKLEKELKKGTKVIAYVWPIDGWTPLKVDAAKDRPTLYLYQR